MANCIHCGESAGFFKKVHPECQERYRKYRAAVDEVLENTSIVVRNALATHDPAKIENLPVLLSKVLNSAQIPQDEVSAEVISCWEAYINAALEDGVLDEYEEQCADALQYAFGLSRRDLDRNGIYSKIHQSKVISGVLRGEPPVIDLDYNPFRMVRGEFPVWMFNSVEFHQDKTKRVIVGKSAGVRFRVAKGVYVNLGASKGTPHFETTRNHIDTGHLLVTNKYLHFRGSSKGMRIAFSKIISFESFRNGIGVYLEKGDPVYFVTGEGWFTNNLIQNIEG